MGCAKCYDDEIETVCDVLGVDMTGEQRRQLHMRCKKMEISSRACRNAVGWYVYLLVTIVVDDDACLERSRALQGLKPRDDVGGVGGVLGANMTICRMGNVSSAMRNLENPHHQALQSANRDRVWLKIACGSWRVSCSCMRCRLL